jgi:hypothetical protein
VAASREAAARNIKDNNNMSVELFKDGVHMAVKTDCKDERDFIDELSELLSILIDNDEYERDWEFQLNYWIPQIVDICCAYRNYKNTVTKKTVLFTGEIQSGNPTHSMQNVTSKEITASDILTNAQRIYSLFLDKVKEEHGEDSAQYQDACQGGMGISGDYKEGETTVPFDK